MNKKLLFSLLTVLTLTACSDGGGNEDLKEWMKQEEKKLKGKIESIPDLKHFKQTPYEAKVDPFELKDKVSLKEIFKNKYAPDLDRLQEELEFFALEQLRMVGTVNKDGKMYAMIKDNGNNIYYVTVNNYMGKNYGKILSITESHMVLDERVKVNEDWTTKETKIYLFEGISSAKNK